MLPETYTIPRETTTWAVTEAGSGSDRLELGNRNASQTEDGERWDGARDVVDDLLWHGDGRETRGTKSEQWARLHITYVPSLPWNSAMEAAVSGDAY